MLLEYKCKKCTHSFEEWYPSARLVPKIVVCPKCKGETEKQLSIPRFNMMGLYPPGYEKGSSNKLTLGKAIDMKQRW